MLSNTALTSLTFMASLETMGAIAAGSPVTQALALMRDRPQEILTSMALNDERPLETLYRLHHQGFERSGLLLWWQERPETHAILRDVRKDTKRKAELSVEDIVGLYFSRLAKTIEKGGQLLLGGSTWYETFADHFIERARKEESPATRAAQLGEIAVNLALHQQIEKSNTVFDEAAGEIARIPSEGNRRGYEDQLAINLARSGQTEKALGYFKTKFDEIVAHADEINAPESCYGLYHLILKLDLPSLWEIRNQMLEAALTLAENKVGDMQRPWFKLMLMGTAGYESGYRDEIDAIIGGLLSRNDLETLTSLTIHLDNYVFGDDGDLNDLQSALLKEAAILARNLPDREAQVHGLITIALAVSDNRQKLSRSFFKEALAIARKTEPFEKRMTLLREIDEEASSKLDRPFSIPELEGN